MPPRRIPTPGQSHLISLAEDFEQVILLQAGLKAFALDADFAAFVLTEQVEG